MTVLNYIARQKAAIRKKHEGEAVAFFADSVGGVPVAGQTDAVEEAFEKMAKMRGLYGEFQREERRYKSGQLRRA